MLVWIAKAALPLRNDGSLDDTSSAQERQRPRWHPPMLSATPGLDRFKMGLQGRVMNHAGLDCHSGVAASQ